MIQFCDAEFCEVEFCEVESLSGIRLNGKSRGAYAGFVGKEEEFDWLCARFVYDYGKSNYSVAEISNGKGLAASFSGIVRGGINELPVSALKSWGGLSSGC